MRGHGSGMRRGKTEKNWQVRVRRDRPGAVAWIFALILAMIMVYLAVRTPVKERRAQSVFAGPNITREVTLQGLKMDLVSLDRCDTAEAARLLAAGYTARGAAGYACFFGDKWHVIGAAYTGERDARRAADKLIRDEVSDAQVIPVEVPELDLRVTAPEIQIDAIEDADGILKTQTERLGEMALQLDRGKINTGTACTLCAAASTQASGCAKVIRSIPGAEENTLTGGLAERLDTLANLLNAIAEERGADAAALSGMMRCAQADIVVGKKELHEKILTGK